MGIVGIKAGGSVSDPRKNRQNEPQYSDLFPGRTEGRALVEARYPFFKDPVYLAKVEREVPLFTVYKNNKEQLPGQTYVQEEIAHKSLQKMLDFGITVDGVRRKVAHHLIKPHTEIHRAWTGQKSDRATILYAIENNQTDARRPLGSQQFFRVERTAAL